MNNLNRTLHGAVLVPLLFTGFTAVLRGAEIVPATEVKSFINQIQLGAEVNNQSESLMTKGHIIHWADALAGETSIKDTSGEMITLKLFTIPFTRTGEVSASIIGGVIDSDKGARIFRFMDAGDLSARIDISHRPVIQAITEPDILDADIGPLIAAHNRRAIFALILRMISNGANDSGMPAKSIRMAFEHRGYFCAAPPIGMPTIIGPVWYATTCIAPSPIDQ